MRVGDRDGFTPAPPTDANPVVHSGGLQSWLSGKQVATIDDGRVDRQFAHRFEFSSLTSGSTLTGGWIEFRVQAIDNGDNDSVFLGFHEPPGGAMAAERWSRRIGSDTSPPVQGLQNQIWVKSAGPFQATYDVTALPAASGPSVDLLPKMNAEGYVDFRVQDDTSVDYAVLTLCSRRTPTDVEVRKRASKSSFQVGETATFTVGVAVSGPFPAAVVVTDQLPNSLSNISVSPSSNCSVSGQTVTCTFTSAPIPAIEITAEVVGPSGRYRNCATAQLEGAEDTRPENTRGCARFVVEPREVIDVKIDKSVEKSSYEIGDDVVFHIGVAASSSPLPAPVVVTDQLPNSLSNISASPSSSCTVSGQTVTCTFTSVPFPLIEITAKAVGPPGRYRNCAQVQMEGMEDPEPGNNQDCVDFEVEPEEPVKLSCREGERRTVLRVGVRDGFTPAPPTDANPVVHGGGLQSWLFGKQVATIDDDRFDRQFAHRFDFSSLVAGSTLTGGWFELRVQANGGATNDGVLLGFYEPGGALATERWGRRFGPDGSIQGLQNQSWVQSAGPFQATYDVTALPAASGPSVDLLPKMNAEGFLDFRVQDDTSVDYAVLTLCSRRVRTEPTDVGVRKRASKSSFQVGETATFTVGVAVSGPFPAAVAVTDQLPSSLGGPITVSPSSNCSVSGQTVTCTFTSAPIPPIEITARVVGPPGRYQNCATAQLEGAEDARPENNHGCTDFEIEDRPGPTAAEVCVVKYEDADESKTYTTNEEVLDGWMIQVLDSNGSLVMQETTGRNGKACFSDLSPGDYTVEEILQSGWKNTDPGTQPPQKSVTLTPGKNPDVEFGNVQIAPSDTLDVAITKSIEQCPWTAGDNCLYRIEVENLGPMDYQGSVTIHDEANVGGAPFAGVVQEVLVFDSGAGWMPAGSVWSCVPGAALPVDCGETTLMTLPAGDVVVLGLVIQYPQAAIGMAVENCASIVWLWPGEHDDPSNNVSCVTTQALVGSR